MITVGIIGPYTPRSDSNHAIETLTNISKGVRMADALAMEGFKPLCPWFDCLYFLVGSFLTIEQVRKMSLEDIRRADVVFLCEGWMASENCKAEYELATFMGKPVFTRIEALKNWRDRMKYAEAAKRDEGPKVNGRIAVMEETLKATTLEIEMLELHLKGHEASKDAFILPPCYPMDGTDKTAQCPAWQYYSKASWEKELYAKLDTARQREAFARNELSAARKEVRA